MTTNQLIMGTATGESCTSVAGWGMVTVWTMLGSTTDYIGSLPDTDGYKITASLTWADTSLYTTSRGGETLTNLDTAYGTCVVSVDNVGNTQLDTEIDSGNQVICHWLYYKGGSVLTAGSTADDKTGLVYGETRYLNGSEWGYNGSGIVGSNIKTLGTALTAG